MTKYYEFVKKLSERKEDHLFLNSDAEKMSAVFEIMLHSAKDEFRIFAGSLCNDTVDKAEFIESMSDFIEVGGKLRILLNNYNKEEAFHSNLFRRLYYYSSLGKDIKIRLTDEQPYIMRGNEKMKVHFSVGDKNAYRIEDNIEKRKAICNMNGIQMAEQLISLFDKIFEGYYKEELDLKLLFERG